MLGLWAFGARGPASAPCPGGPQPQPHPQPTLCVFSVFSSSLVLFLILESLPGCSPTCRGDQWAQDSLSPPDPHWSHCRCGVAVSGSPPTCPPTRPSGVVVSGAPPNLCPLPLEVAVSEAPQPAPLELWSAEPPPHACICCLLPPPLWSHGQQSPPRYFPRPSGVMVSGAPRPTCPQSFPA